MLIDKFRKKGLTMKKTEALFDKKNDTIGKLQI